MLQNPKKNYFINFLLRYRFCMFKIPRSDALESAIADWLFIYGNHI